MRFGLLTITALVLSLALIACRSRSSSFGVREWTPDELEQLARCLTERGWVMYGTSTCSGCRAQRKSFGDAFAYINYVECDPYEANSEPDRCLKANIRKTPTWMLEVDGKEVQRLELYQLPEDLAKIAGCEPGMQDRAVSPSQ